MPAAPKPIPVVCAVIERDGCVLLAQRPGHKHPALKWEFPGGKIEPGENPVGAIIREIHEELGCTLVVGRALPRFQHTYSHVTIEMIPFVCRLAPGSPEPHPHEHIALIWVPLSRLKSYDLAAADLPVVDSIAAAMPDSAPMMP
ncbi:MAG: (deoxy)nucleoside triphosphate pyrophosphohydrolase [Opitutaceae bacterium]|nr:(deoxy)nucleoside triphosphate pyrophosphohydrolase [Opitutaceae bacterium]